MSRTILIFFWAFAGFAALGIPNLSSAQEVVYLQEGSSGGISYGSSGGGLSAWDGCTTPVPYSSDYSTGYGTPLPTTTLHPSEFDEDAYDSTYTSAREGGELYLSRIPTGKRTGMFQKANFNALWVPNSGGSKGLGMTQLDLSATFALPMLKPESPLVITPSFQAWFFDPKSDRVRMTKKSLYTTGVDFRWIKPIVKNKFTLDIGIAALYSGDFHISGSKAMRFPAHAAAIWNCNPRLKVILGVVYLDREDDYNWLPMAGLIWTPHDDLSVEMVLPRARIAQRIRWFGSAAGDDKSDWLYAAFEFGGGSWGHKMDGYAGHIDYRDLRALVGYERRTAFGLTIAIEAGYMFNRKVEFDRLNYKADAADNVFLRLRTSF